MSEAQKQGRFSNAGFWGMVVVTVLGCAMIGYAARPVKVELPTATIGAQNNYSVPGTSVASSADGSIIVLGEPSSLTGKAGAAYVYVEPSGHKGWGGTLPSPVTLTNPDSDYNFGTSVAISSDGSRIVVGDPGLGSNNGAVWVFDEPTGGWAGGPVTQDKELTSPASGGMLGTSVAISSDGNTVVAGAPVEQLISYANAGDGYVFTYSTSSSAWSGPTDLAGLGSFPTIGSSNTGIEAGYSVAIVGNGTGAWAFLGAPFSTNGSVYAFQHQASGWKYIQTLNGPDAGEDFGWSVAAAEVAGTTTPTLAVGASHYRTNSLADVGKAFIYGYDATSQKLTLATSLTAPTQAANNQFGYSVALDSGDTKLVIGSLPANGANNTDVPGRLYQYDEPSKGKTLLGWSSSLSPTDIFVDTSASTISPDDGFGSAVAVGFTGRDTWVLGGAPLVPAAYIFEGK